METSYFSVIGEGALNTLLIVILSSILPVGLGILFTVLSSKSKTAQKVFSWVSLPFECLCPITFLVVLYFSVTRYIHIYMTPLPAVVIALTFCFIGYIPSRYVDTYSLKKNIIYNMLGLYRNIFMWSFCASIIGCMDLLSASKQIMATTYYAEWYFVPFAFAFVVLLAIEIPRKIIKQKMK